MQFSANIIFPLLVFVGERDVDDSVSPLRSDTLHCSSHQRIRLEDSVEVVDREGEQVTIRLSSHTEQDKK